MKTPTMKKRGRGQPPFEPTKAQRAMVMLAAGNGLAWDTIRQVIISPRTGKPISKETLQSAFFDELAKGKAEMDLATLTSLARQIKAGNMTAIIWRMKNQMGWKDVQQQEISGPDGKQLVTGIQVSFVRPKPNGHAVDETD